MSELKHGDVDSFEKNWQERDETYYTHWTRTEPQNQIQLAFRNHWSLLNELMGSSYFKHGRRVLEVGCGRGSLSCYFSDAGYDCTLLDISKSVIDIAQKIFKAHHLRGTFEIGDANALPFDDKSFDIVFSIGLLEHFENVEPPIQEQIRVLDEGGLLFCYVVPEYSDSVQEKYEWINEILKGYVKDSSEQTHQKLPVWRSTVSSQDILFLLEKHGLGNVKASGVYPLPMISHSTEFPFTLMPEESEKALVSHFEQMLEENGRRTSRNPWLCEEGYGQAFVMWGYK